MSMDGPNANWKMLNKITEERCSVEHYPGLINVGACKFHAVHGAFRSGMIKTKWRFDSVLKALHNLFDESAAKREDYIKVTGSEMFALPFCGHRWIEDKKVAERDLEISPHIITYTCENLKKSESNSHLKFILHIEISCTEQLNHCKTRIFCFSCSSAETLLGDLSVRCPTSAIYHFRTSSYVGHSDGKFVKTQEPEAANTPLKIPK